MIRGSLTWMAVAVTLALPASAQEAIVDAGGPRVPSDSMSPDGGAAPSEGAAEELDLFQLDAQLATPVVSSTKIEQTGAQTPAVVSIVTADEIRARGYQSLADVLHWVPGFYDIYDGVTHNVGVRGINGGQGASGSLIKVMIDGQPVDFRPTTGNFFGPELIPMEVIERIEIIRGPASALYGANAYLGVINVITKSGDKVHGLELVGQGELLRSNLGGGGGVVLGGQSGPVDAIVGANYLSLNRSGLTLPTSSPDYGTLTAGGVQQTQGDIARPKSLFAKAAVNVLGGKVTGLASVQSLDAADEFENVAPLSTQSRAALLNQNYRLSYETALSDRWNVRASVDYFQGNVTPDDHLGVGRSDYLLEPVSGASGVSVAAEAQERILPGLSLTEGADFTLENYTLQTFSRLYLENIDSSSGAVLYPLGTLIPGEVGPEGTSAQFRNVGAFLQALWSITDAWALTAGARLDDHSLFGAFPNGRFGVVYSPPSSPLSLKLLYGSSFKPPSAVQLYTEPPTYLGVEGNPNLKPQTANTFELFGGYQLPKGIGEVSANLFGTDVEQRVEFFQEGEYFQAQNIPEEFVVGGEIDGRFAILRSLHARFIASIAQTVANSSTPVLQGLPQVVNPLFPNSQLGVVVDWLLPWAIRISPEGTFVGPRSSSQSNALIEGQAYQLPAYFALGGSISTRHKFFADRETSIALRITDALGTQWSEPGFGGIDIPTEGRTFLLTIVQGL